MFPLVIALGAGTVAGILYAVVIERNWFAARNHRVPCLPPGARPMRILHVSDLHLRARQQRKHAFLRALARIEPDLIVATGDFLGDADAVPATLETMRAMRAGKPGLFVLGSNDYYAPVLKSPLGYFLSRGEHRHGPENPWRDLVAGLEADGWRPLHNEATDLDGLEIVGLGDAHIGLADLSAARARSGRGFRLAIAHSPDVAEPLARLGYDLVVCGHTHGGQLRVPRLGALVTNSSLPRRMARGLHRIGNAWLHVSAGAGTSKYAPFRFACRPEACVLDLVPREG